MPGGSIVSALKLILMEPQWLQDYFLYLETNKALEASTLLMYTHVSISPSRYSLFILIYLQDLKKALSWFAMRDLVDFSMVGKLLTQLQKKCGFKQKR